MTTATPTRPPRPFRPATAPVCGSVTPRVRITTDKGVASDFGLVFLTPDPAVATAAVRLVKDDGEMYDLSLDADGVARCDCGDGTFHPERPGGCKHLCGLRALIRRFVALAPLAEAPTAAGYPPAPKSAAW